MTKIVRNINPGEVNFTITSVLQNRRLFDGFIVRVFPTKISLTQSKRITKVNNLQGSVIQHFNNKFNNNNDLLELSLRISTRNIHVFKSSSPDEDGERLDNLENYYALMALAEEPSIVGGNMFNYIKLNFMSVTLKSKISLYAFFREMPKIEEDVASPSEVSDISLNFWILDKKRIDYRQLHNAISAYRREIGATESRAGGLSGE